MPRRCARRESRIAGFDRLEITTCLRRGELEIVTRYEPDAQPVYARADGRAAANAMRAISFRKTASLVDDQVAALLAGRRIATAESCTAGLVAARLTDLPGSSALCGGRSGGLRQRGQDRACSTSTLRSSRRTARSPNRWPRRWPGCAAPLRADTAVAITGIAGPGGGTEDKPVGTVCFSVMLADGPKLTQNTSAARQPLRYPGALDDGRDASCCAEPCSARKTLQSLQD